MDKIASFTVNHLDLIPGVYVSRKDYVGKEVLTTFDLRMTAPNREPVMNTAELHTIEHLAATYLRNNDEWKEKVIYFGPMGCRTGCYLILAGDYESKDVVGLVRDTFSFIADYEGEIPVSALFQPPPQIYMVEPTGASAVVRKFLIVEVEFFATVVLATAPKEL